MERLGITVEDLTGILKTRPVTGGVPLSEGAAPAGAVFHLHAADGTEIPLQASVSARWKDGSARWVLLDFQAQPEPLGKALYSLTWTSAGEGGPAPDPERNGLSKVELGNVAVSLTDGALVTVSERLDLVLTLTDGAGTVYTATVEDAGVETAGPMRLTLAIRGSFIAPDGARAFQFRFRASVYAGLPLVRLEPMILLDAERGVMQPTRELRLTLRPRNPVKRARLGGDPAWDGPLPEAPVRLFQVDDEQYRFEGAPGAGGKAPGWAEFEDGAGTVAVALRDFWQQWPKSLEAGTDGVALGLFPRFREGDFAHMEPWYKYQYLFEGDCYRLRTGQARKWDIWLDLSGDGPALARAAAAPLVPAADPAQAIATGVWDAIVPAGAPELAEYDVWVAEWFQAYCDSIAAQRDYGAMNWGDWHGERVVNWGNHEYDTANQILIQFARTGDPRYFHVADAAARHSSEVDTIHHVNPELLELIGKREDFPAGPGLVHQHTVGHVSGFYSPDRLTALYHELGVDKRERPYLCLDPYNLGHIWTQGMARHYFLTGDPFVRETVDKIGGSLAGLVEGRQYQFTRGTHFGRVTGWTLLALAGAYEIAYEDRYLQVMKTLVDDTLEAQDPVCGGWVVHPMAPDHCVCAKTRHAGMAGFITAVLINGISRYYFLTGDERLPEAITKGATFLNNDTWREEWRDWRYTSCPATGPTRQPGVVVLAQVNGIRASENAELLRVLRVAWDAKFHSQLQARARQGNGKEYSSKMLGCAEAIGVLLTHGA